nr:Gag-Pol polyprotein [Tanacetum cinerariifolium]
MSTQQDIYAAGFENRSPMLNKDNYVPWSSRIIRYARSRPNGKMIVDSIKNGPYEKKAKLFNEWEKFTSTDRESIESYYHRFMQLMNDLKRNKHFPENIATNLKFLNNLQPEWKRHVTIVRQTKNLHEANFTHIYDFIKMNQDENGGIQVAQNAVQNAGVQSGGDLDEIEEVNANCILMANLQDASTSGIQLRYNSMITGVFVPQMTKSKEELFLSNVLNMVTVSKTISIPNEDLSDDITPSVARKFLNEVKSSLVTLQRLVEQRLWKFTIGHLLLIKSHDIMSIVQNGFVDVPYDLQIELDHTKEKLELCIIKKEKEYAVLWNNWYTKCEECKYDKVLYDKAYNDMQQKVKRLQAQLRDLKCKSSDTPSVSNTLDPLNQKLESKIVELEFQVVNYEREISHLKTTYKNLFDSITSNRAHAKLHDLIYKNAQLRTRVFENTSESMKNTSVTSVTPHVYKPTLNP